MFHEDLIYDFGLNDGRDTEFYLLKGYRVIAVEANPNLYVKARETFSEYIATGQLVLLNVGVWSDPGMAIFYINDNDHWSSFDPAYGCRNGTGYRTVEVQCVTAAELLRRFGIPYYMKIDVEGADRHILEDLKKFSVRPRMASVEEYGVSCIDTLNELGYLKFQIVAQWEKSKAIPPNPPREGNYVEREFRITDTGLFGKELPGIWMTYTDARNYFTSHIRDESFNYLGPDYEWYDVHAIA